MSDFNKIQYQALQEKALNEAYYSQKAKHI